MRRERIVWIIALLVVAAAGFYGGQVMGARASAQNRAAAAQDFFSQRGGGQDGGQGGAHAARQGQGQGDQGSGVAGTVSSVSDNTVTITTRNNQTTKVQLASNGTVRKQVTGQLSDIKQGDQVVAFGTQNGDTFQANTIQIGGFGGRQGDGNQEGNGAPGGTAPASQ